MPHRQTQVQIPNRRDDEPPASPDQLQRIRALTTGLSLHGFRFDYRKLGTEQAETILQQLRIMSEQQNNTAPPARKKGPGCIASFAKATTALIVWAFILAAVAGGGYLIYWKMNQTPKTADTTDPTTTNDNAAPDTSDTPGKTGQSTIFEGLGVSDNNTPTDTTPDQPKPTPDTNTPTPNPEPTPPAAIADDDLAKQLVGLEKLLVSLSQYTRNDFAPDLRARSSQGMQNKLDAYPQALAALDRIDPTLSPRIRAAVDAFAAPTLDGPALREDIKSIRQAITDLQ